MGLHILSTILTLLLAVIGAYQTKAWAQTDTLSINRAIELMLLNNNIIQQANKSVEIAHAEKQKLNSTWYPFVTAGGTYMHLSNEIEVKENIQELVEPFVDAIPELEAIAQKLTPILGQYGQIPFSVPLIGQDIATIDGTITWPLFTGGKRIYANRIGKSLVASAELLKKTIGNNQTVLLIEKYYTAKLTKKIVGVQQQNLNAMQKLYDNAKKMMAAGAINKAEMLVTKVAWQQAKRELENAISNDSIAGNALHSMLYNNHNGYTTNKSGYDFVYTSPFFMCMNIPSKGDFKAMIYNSNPQMQIIQAQQDITQNQFKIAKSGYIPQIALFGKQNIYSYNIPKNLSPRTVIGAGFIWNLFDGLNREKNMQIAKKEHQILQLAHNQLQKDLYLLSDQLYSKMIDAKNNIETINTSIELAEELAKIRETSFKEGMATSLEVVNAHTILAKTHIAAAMAYFQYDISLSALLAISGESSRFTDYMINAEMIME